MINSIHQNQAMLADFSKLIGLGYEQIYDVHKSHLNPDLLLIFHPFQFGTYTCPASQGHLNMCVQLGCYWNRLYLTAMDSHSRIFWSVRHVGIAQASLDLIRLWCFQNSSKKIEHLAVDYLQVVWSSTDRHRNSRNKSPLLGNIYTGFAASCGGQIPWRSIPGFPLTNMV